jgi:hypothetical protein
MNLSIRRTPLVALAAATALALTACSTQTAGDAGVELINGELGEQLELGPLEPECGEPASLESGETFTCTATTEGGDTIEFDGIVESDDGIFMSSSNVIYADDLMTLEAAAVQSTATEFEVDPATLTVDCPDENTILDDDTVTCEITDVTEGTPYELFITFGEFVLKEGFSGWEYELGEPVD